MERERERWEKFTTTIYVLLCPNGKKNCLEERPVQTFEWNKLLKEKEDEDE
jgi:hypothetical protein